MEGSCQVCKTSGPLDPQGLCGNCSLLLSATLPSVHSTLRGAYRTCSRCKKQVPNSQVTCDCGYMELGLVDLPEASLPPTTLAPADCFVVPNPCWTCGNCSYEYSREEVCDRCGCGKPAQAPTASAQQPTPYWACGKCGYQYNTQEKCQYCVVEQVPTATEQQTTQYWKCGTCGYEGNTKESCEYCAYYYAQSQETPKGDYWTCQSCGYQHSQTERCDNCEAPKDAPPGSSSVTYSPQTVPLLPDAEVTAQATSLHPGYYQHYQSEACSEQTYQPPPSNSQAAWTYQAGYQASSGGRETDTSAQGCTNPSSQTFFCPACNTPYVPSVGCENCRAAAQPTTHCTKCESTVAEGTSICCNCAGKPRTPSISSHPSSQPEEKKSKKWKCWECGVHNDPAHEKCKDCRTSKHFHHFLIMHKMRTTEDKKHWVCKCDHPNPLMDESCSKCKRINMLVIHGKKGQGHIIGPFTFNFEKPKGGRGKQ